MANGEIYSVADIYYDYDENLVDIADMVTDRFKLDPEIVAIGVQWARDWFYLIQDGGNELDENTLLRARDIALDGLPVPRDHTEGRPTFRVRFAAKEALIAMSGDNGEIIREILDGKGSIIIPDFERIDQVITTLADSYERKLYPYNLDSTRVPQDPRHMPRNLELDVEKCDEQQKIQLASFWFADCYYMRGVNDSNDMTINLAKLYEDHPEIFDFKNAMHLEPKYIESLLLDYHLPVQHKAISNYWVENARRMVERYDGDPTKIFEDFGTYDELVSRTRNNFRGDGFKGFQKKMTSMLGYFYMATDLIPYQNIPLPVDFHVMRMSISNEMIRFDNMPESGFVEFEKTTDFLREVFFDLADHLGINQLDLCDIVWLYSREACVNSPTNSQKIIGKRKGRSTIFAPAIDNADQATPEQIEAYDRSCGICRLRETCAHNVPSGPYYVTGNIKWPDPKIHFNSNHHELHDNEAFESAQKRVAPPPNGHAIDIRDRNRQGSKNKRMAIIRRLAHPPLIVLDGEQKLAVAHGIIDAPGDSRASLSGKKFAFTYTEVCEALGQEPTREELLHLEPYMSQPDQPSLMI